MNNKLKETVIKNCVCYFFDNIINRKILDANKIKIDENT